MARGITAVEADNISLLAEIASAIPLYIGSAPLWQIDDVDWKERGGHFYLLSSDEDAKRKIGYYQPDSGMWPKWASVSEAVNQHFMRALVGPIAVLVAPMDNLTTEEKTESLTVYSGTASISGSNIVASSVKIEGMEKDKDFSVSYDTVGKKLNITITKKITQPNVSATWEIIKNPDAVTLGTVMDNMDYIQQEINVIPSTVAVPGWEAVEGVADQFTTMVESVINRHWRMTGFFQADADSVSAAVTAKDITSYRVKSCWPYVEKEGLIYHLSTIYSVTKMAVDAENDGVPFVSESNEVIDCTSICTKNGTKIRLREADSNLLNEAGIATVNYVDGAWRTWGIRMSNYAEADAGTILVEKRTDTAVRMRDYICNDFQQLYFDYVDKPIDDRQAREIAEDYQGILDGMVASGQILYGHIQANTTNAGYSAALGNFVFDIEETSIAAGNSITAYVKYTSAGFQVTEEA